MLRVFRLATPWLMSLTLVVTATTSSTGAQSPRSLYDRLGGYNAISAVVEAFADRLFTDPKIAKFFVGMSTDSRAGFKQKNKNLVCAVTGGPCQVISRPAKTAHAGLGITGADFEVVENHLVAVLDGFKVPAGEKKELLDIIGTLRADIVERP